MPVIPATCEVEVGGLKSEAALGKKCETLFEKKKKAHRKRAGTITISTTRKQNKS
jgi:hypothetical protein